jgi:transcriptional regulator with PAS, ATPase and Fis domain
LDEIQLQLRNLAAADISVLIIGETGTGKEYLAKRIHERSQRSKKPFQAINCATLTSERISAELFGYRKGAFTGADRDEPGLLRRADGGTVLLDELGDLPEDCWGSLLRFLQDGEIHLLGCPTERVNVRVLAATNKPERLPKDIQYRFDHQIEVPALRFRRVEIAELANSFFEDAKSELNRASLRFGTDERAHLAGANYDWPGNVRQLRAAVRNAVLLHGTGRDVLADEILKAARRLDSLAD